MGRKRMANKKSSSAMLTRSRKAILNAHSDPQPLTILTPTLDSDSDHQPPKSNKAKTNTSGASSSMASKKREDKDSTAIVTESSNGQCGKTKVDSGSDSNKFKTNTTSDDGSNRHSKEILKSPLAVAQRSKFKKPKTPAKKLTKANVEPSAMVETNISDGGAASSSVMATKSSNRRGKKIVKSPLAVAEKAKFKKPKTPPKKMANIVESSSSVAAKKTANVEPSNTKGKAKLDPSARKIQSLNSKKIENVETKGKAKEENTTGSMHTKLTISEERANVQTSGVLTRSGKAKLGSTRVTRSFKKN